jgi:hypothetical protein
MTQCTADCARLRSHIDAELASEATKRLIKARWGRYMLLLVPWFAVLMAVAFMDVLVALEPVLPANVLNAPLTTTLLGWARPVVGVIEPVALLLGAATVTQRLLGFAAAFLILSILVQFLRCRGRGLRTRSAAEIAQLRNYVDAVALMTPRVTQMYQKYVRAAQTPEFGGVLSPAGGASTAAAGAAGAGM